MITNILCAGHLVIYIASTSMRTVLYKYLKKKPLGLQSALDHLILDMVKNQMFNYTLFILFLFCGLVHGELPYLPSQIFIWILIQSGVYLLGLYQFFLIVKGIIIFRGVWIENLEGLNDDKLAMISRIFASIYTLLRAVGDYFLTTPRNGPMITFLTGTEYETWVRTYELWFIKSKFTYLSQILSSDSSNCKTLNLLSFFRAFRSGPLHLLAILILLVSNFALLIKTSRLQRLQPPIMDQEHHHRKSFCLMSGVAFSFVLVIAGMIVLVSGEKFGLFLLFSLIQSIVNHSFTFYYFLTLPELKKYYIQCAKDFAQIKFVNSVLSSLKFIFECWIDMVLLLICIGPRYPKMQPSKVSPNVVQTV